MKARCAGSQLILTVRDDGQGMTESCMRMLEQGQQTTSERAHGVHNVVERLHLYYGAQASLHYNSDGRSFTKATICLPISRDKQETQAPAESDD